MEANFDAAGFFITEEAFAAGFFTTGREPDSPVSVAVFLLAFGFDFGVFDGGGIMGPLLPGLRGGIGVALG